MSKDAISDIVGLEKIYHRRFIEDQQKLRMHYKEKHEFLEKEFQNREKEEKNIIDQKLVELQRHLDEEIADIKEEYKAEIEALKQRGKRKEGDAVEELVNRIHKAGSTDHV